MRKQKLIATIKIEELPKASILIYYGGNIVTRTIGKLFYKQKGPVPHHTALYIGQGTVVNIGKVGALEDVYEHLKEEDKIEAIVFDHLTDRERNTVITRAKKDIGKPYDIAGFLAFGKQLPVIGKWFNDFEGSEQLPFCSDNIVDSFKVIGMKVSNKPNELTAPWDILSYERKEKQGKIYTLIA